MGKTKRCVVCKKKTVVGITCSCGLYTCIAHRYPDVHDCINQKKKEIIDKDAFDNKILTETIVNKKVDII